MKNKKGGLSLTPHEKASPKMDNAFFTKNFNFRIWKKSVKKIKFHQIIFSNIYFRYTLWVYSEKLKFFWEQIDKKTFYFFSLSILAENGQKMTKKA